MMTSQTKTNSKESTWAVSPQGLPTDAVLPPLVLGVKENKWLSISSHSRNTLQTKFLASGRDMVQLVKLILQGTMSEKQMKDYYIQLRQNKSKGI